MTGRTPDAATDAGLSGLLADIERLAGGGGHVTLDALLATIGPRGFGPVIVTMALILILPLGMIPGMPGFVAIVLAAIGVELALGRHALKPPRRLRDLRVPAALLAGIARRLRPLARWSGRVLRPRLPFLAAARPGGLLIAAVLILSSGVIFVLGFIPGLPFALAWPLLLIGLGLTVRDGAAVVAGLALYLPVGLLIVRIFLWSGSTG
jgi:hypothetical protein